MTNYKDIPTETHWVIITDDSFTVHHEGDERSRTNPGHGYPASTETVSRINYQVFPYANEADWRKLIDHLTKTNKKFKAFKVYPAVVTVETKIEVV